MTLRRRILVNGLLAALPLALIGYLLVQAAGVWMESQTAPRSGVLAQGEPLAPAMNTADVTSLFAWKLPLFLAFGGFLFVAIGESLKSIWKRPARAKT